MEKQESRIALRLPSDVRERMRKLVSDGQYKNLSEVVRDALARLLKENAGE